QLACHPASAGLARRFARRLAPPETASTVELLVSELVTNAVVHARSDLVLSVISSSSGIRVEVRDASPSPPMPRATGSEDAELSQLGDHGRGLQLVAALATQWGTRPHGTGKSVWFEVLADRRCPRYFGAVSSMGSGAGAANGTATTTAC
ncbi:MAG: ATP-binding protein, partial [Acidimicrobiales bacterium]